MKKIKQAVERAVLELGFENPRVELEHPAKEEHGDYSSNIAMRIFSKLQDPNNKLQINTNAQIQNYKNPKELAEEIVAKLRKDEELSDVVERVEVAGAGFVNFYLKESWFLQEMGRAVKEGEEYGKGKWGQGRRVLVEYSSPNIAKDFSIGHLRSTIIGQALRNLYEAGGWESVGDNHLGDWGTQFGMIIAAVEEEGREIGEMSVEEMEKMYVEYNQKAKEDEKYQEKAREAFKRLEEGEKRAREIWKKAKEASIEEFGRIYELLDVEIEHALGESFYEDKMGEVIEEMKEKGVAVEGEGGALIVKFEEMPPAMVLKSDGATTYFTRDMATVKYRRENLEFRSDLYVYEVGAEQKLHFRQVFRAAEMMGWGEKEDYVHVAHGLVLGKDGKKLSTRKGTSEKLEDFLEAMIEKAREVNSQTAEEVGVGAVKYMDLKHEPRGNYVFDVKKALSLKGNSGPYLQYTYARAMSVLEKAIDAGYEPMDTSGEGELDIGYEPMAKEEKAILRWFYRYGERVELAGEELKPNLLCEYMYELASRYNSFYNKHRILEAEEGKRDFRLLITASVGQILENGLEILGIEALEEM